MEPVAAAFRNHTDLATARSSAFCGIHSSAHAKFGDGFERNLQSCFGLLRLLLNTASIDAIESEIVIVTRTSVEANIAFGPARCIDGSWSEHHESGEGASIQRNLANLR